MCLLLIAHDAHPRLRLIAAANRDEYYAWPTAPLGWWDDHPQVLAGRDLERGGTWIGVTRGGRFAALTNFREPGERLVGAPSRGALVADFLTGAGSALGFTEGLARHSAEYNGFNLVLGDGEQLVWLSNRGGGPLVLEPGLHGLSNHLLGTPWPKLEGGLEEFGACIGHTGDELIDRALGLLGDRATPPDERLPDTGFGLARERILGARFVVSPDYGTRSSSVILCDREGGGLFVEQTFDRGAPLGATRRFAW